MKSYFNDELEDNKKFLLLIGTRIRLLREERGLSQTKLAELMNNRDPQVVQRLESGKTNVTVGLLRIVAIALEVDISDLLH